jgi:predicted ATPase
MHRSIPIVRCCGSGKSSLLSELRRVGIILLRSLGAELLRNKRSKGQARDGKINEFMGATLK